MKEKLVSPCHHLFPRIPKQTEDFLLEPFQKLLYSSIKRNPCPTARLDLVKNGHISLFVLILYKADTSQGQAP